MERLKIGDIAMALKRDFEKNDPLEALKRIHRACSLYLDYTNDGVQEEDFKIIETALKDYENLKEENKSLKENLENLNETYFDTWFACEKLKINSNYALMFVDGKYCLVDTKDNKFNVINTYDVKKYGIIDNGTEKKLKALEIIKEKFVVSAYIVNSKNAEEYNRELRKITFRQDYEKRKLTEEDFNLLKEVLI